jgi:hypothetical protein
MKSIFETNLSRKHNENPLGPASKLSPDTKYPEKELNLIIAKYHADTAALRRYMIEYGILERDGESVYWVVT